MNTLATQEAQTTTHNAGAAEARQTSYTTKCFEKKPQRQARSAIFVAHGMGQQMRFETLAQIAEGLRAEDASRRNKLRPEESKAIQPEQSETIQIAVGDKLLHGIRVKLFDAMEKPDVEVDIFEGYWAPLTEGQITLRNVISFLINGGINGCKNTIRPFTRFLFRNHCEYRSHLRVLVALLIALLVIFSLVSMNSAIVLVTAGKSLFSQSVKIHDGFIIDLTTVFDLFLAAAIIYISALAVALLLRHPERTPRTRRLIGIITRALFWFPTLPTTIVAGIAIAYLSYKHLSSSAPKKLITSPAPDFNWWFGVVMISMLAVSLVSGAIYLLFQRRSAASSRPRQGRKIGAITALFGAALVVGAIALAALGLAKVLPTPRPDSPNWVELSPWPLLVAISEIVRRLLVEYVGDVAIYVAPYSLDRFFLLREKIRETVVTTAQIVYEKRNASAADKPQASDFQYQNVYVVGHSLGSVIVYDLLNRMISDDVKDAGNNGRLDVAGRTKMLITFGSPLDKIAFLFMRPDYELCEARDAMQSATQPLIGDTAFRQFPWLNIFSPLDIISGNLNFFDPPEEGDGKRIGPEIPEYQRVINLTDPQATLYLAAHVEYWNNKLLFGILHSSITGNIGELEELVERNRAKKKR